VPAELAAHRLHDLPGEVFLVARGEPRVEGGGQHGARHALVDGGQQGPTAFAGVGYAVLGDRLGLDRRSLFSRKASAVRSSSQDAMTLPRRQFSQIADMSKSYW